jgi:uncharacterized protein YjbI with pentapeptide repeats
VPVARLTLGLGIVLLLTLLGPTGPVAAAPPVGQVCPETPAELAGRNLSSVEKLPDLRCADLRGAILDEMDLIQVDLRGVNAQGASFRHAQLGQARFTGADLRGAHFEHADLGQAYLDRTHANSAFFAHAKLDQADVHASDLRGADYLDASLIQTDLSHADLRGASLLRASLIQANLSHADLRGASLLRASLIQANLSHADLRGANTYWATSVQADVSGALVDRASPRNFQLGPLAVLAALLVLIRSVITVARGRGNGKGLRTGALRMGLFLAIGVSSWLTLRTLVPLLLVDVAYPALIVAGILLLSGLVHGYVPSRFRSAKPAGPMVDGAAPATP